MKERFKLIFQYQPQKSATWVFCLLLIMILAGGTLVSCQSQSIQSNGKGSIAKLYALFGSSEQDVLASLSLNTDQNIEKTTLSPNSVDYLLKQPVQVHGHSSQLQLGFYNNILMALQYRFDNHKDAFDVSKALRDELVKLLGQPSTIEGHPNRLNTLTALPTGRTLPAEYLEEWSITVEPQVLADLLGNTTLSVNLELRLSLLDESHASVSVRYSMNRNSLQPPRP
ncbi:hypothetical protein [Paenibacillus sp. MBLB4367]|uniref:hypothetical protein n=1 Tax=Paenibacillus sp. MBLB4367 TaxID=3384767 RepID=UPI003907FDD8